MRAFERSVFLFRHQEKTEQPSFIQFVTPSQHWRLQSTVMWTVRSAAICVPVIRLNYSNRSDRENRRLWCFACALFVGRTFKSLNIPQVLHVYFTTIVGAIPVTDTGLCNALMEMMFSVLCVIQVMKRMCIVFEYKWSEDEKYFSLNAKLCSFYFDLAVLADHLKCHFLGFTVWTLFWYWTSWRTNCCPYHYKRWLREAVWVGSTFATFDWLFNSDTCVCHDLKMLLSVYLWHKIPSRCSVSANISGL